MLKIGIISEFNMQTVNYGNNLQAYALNYYLNKLGGCIAESIYFRNYMDSNVTRQTVQMKRNSCRKVLHKLERIPYKITDLRTTLLRKRQECFVRFAKKNINMPQFPMTWESLLASDYNVFIVGSDVVWRQRRGSVNRIKYLDFKNSKEAIKVAYAASLGENYIPKENRKVITIMLKNFKAISVREASTVRLLDSLGVENVVHMPDPTLLLEKQEWELIESCPRFLMDRKASVVDIETEKYLFAYLLGADRRQRAAIKRYAKGQKLRIVSIPYATGYWNDNDKYFGDILAWNCSPEEWVWLIRHAEFVVTDSFHGTVFATIFQKKFLVQMRYKEKGMNDRIQDYLGYINQLDKSCSKVDMAHVSDLKWNYEEINKKIDEFRERGQKFLKKELNIGK